MYNDMWNLLYTFGSILGLIVLSPVQIQLAHLWQLWAKVKLFVYGIFYIILSKDTKFQLPTDPGKSRATATRTKRILFVRHGESVWNECFNRGFGASFLPTLLWALFREAMLLFSMDSLFFDSPLSEDGLAQCAKLQEFVESSEGEEIRKMCEGAVFVTSCLRRAAATVLLGFSQSLKGGKPVWTVSSLQEISRNVDTLQFAGPLCAPPLSLPPSLLGPAALGSRGQTGRCTRRGLVALSASAGQYSVGKASAPCGGMQAAFNSGNKGLQTNGGQRLEAFCEWVFSDCSPTALQPTVVVGGHSLWFRTFFQAYMPHAAYHECKQAKIANCGIVMFDLEQLEAPESGSVEYRVVPGSVVSLYGGFEASKPRRWQGKNKAE